MIAYAKGAAFPAGALRIIDIVMWHVPVLTCETLESPRKCIPAMLCFCALWNVLSWIGGYHMHLQSCHTNITIV